MKRRDRERGRLPTLEEIFPTVAAMFSDEYLDSETLVSPEILVSRAIALGFEGRLDEAVRCLDMAIENDPNYPDAWYNKGIARINQENLPSALECMQMAASLDTGPDLSGLPWLKLCEIHKKMGSSDRALQCLNRSLELGLDNVETFQEMANLYIELGENEKALEAIERAKQIDSGLDSLKVKMGEILQSLDRQDDALASFREARESRQDASSALFGEGEILFKKGSYDEALRCFDAALKGSDKKYQAQASIGKGYALLAQGRYGEALKEFKLNTRRYSESSDLALGKGMAQMGMRRAAEALKFVERAIRLRPENARARYEKGKLHKKLGNEAEAQAAFAESERLGGKFDENSPYWPY